MKEESGDGGLQQEWGGGEGGQQAAEKRVNKEMSDLRKKTGTRVVSVKSSVLLRPRQLNCAAARGTSPPCSPPHAPQQQH